MLYQILLTIGFIYCVYFLFTFIFVDNILKYYRYDVEKRKSLIRVHTYILLIYIVYIFSMLIIVGFTNFDEPRKVYGMAIFCSLSCLFEHLGKNRCHKIMAWMELNDLVDACH